ncbi:hypothetical protein PVK06_025001 [Gossypium arboreum]|uniref:Uncharacterized protein n=1 Tax=Gossypium arboreum TaxID=29729 RepID=A0ABR0PFE5_GOSAR|nr:hypothetical protein PVK06_025001 [Gossypium arboreum]
MNDTSNPTQFKAHDGYGLSFPQGPITRSKSKQLKSKLNLFVQGFIIKKFCEEKLKLQDDKLWSSIRSEDEFKRSKFVRGLKISIHDDKTVWNMLTSLSITLQEAQSSPHA